MDQSVQAKRRLADDLSIQQRTERLGVRLGLVFNTARGELCSQLRKHRRRGHPLRARAIIGIFCP